MCGTGPVAEGPAHDKRRSEQGADDTAAVEIATRRLGAGQGRGHEQRRRGVKSLAGPCSEVLLAALDTSQGARANGQEMSTAGRAAVRELALVCPSLYDPSVMLMECSGDIHPRPGPLQVESANVTSLQRHWRQVMTARADIICLQQTRLTAAGQRAMTALSKKMRW